LTGREAIEHPKGQPEDDWGAWKYKKKYMEFSNNFDNFEKLKEELRLIKEGKETKTGRVRRGLLRYKSNLWNMNVIWKLTKIFQTLKEVDIKRESEKKKM
jgi:hypothetical protein